MKTFELKFEVQDIEKEKIFDFMFSDTLITELNGVDTNVFPWKNNRKLLKIVVDAQKVHVNIPNEIKRFCGGNIIKSTVKLHVLSDDDQGKKIRIRIKPHVLGSELFINRVFAIVSDGQVILTAEVHAIFPKPLNDIFETFMINFAMSNFQFYANIIQKHFAK